MVARLPQRLKSILIAICSSLLTPPRVAPVLEKKSKNNVDWCKTSFPKYHLFHILAQLMDSSIRRHMYIVPNTIELLDKFFFNNFKMYLMAKCNFYLMYNIKAS